MNIPIFPLAIYLLPGGITRLRIFEQRYISMVKNMNTTQGFVISYYQKDKQHHISEWGSWVDLVNFELGDDNILVIDVKCKGLVKIEKSEHLEDKLLWGDVVPITHWADKKITISDLEVSGALKQVFEDNLHLSEVYQNKFDDDLSWVCARWVELLPIDFTLKTAFIQEYSFEQALGFLKNLLHENTVSTAER